MQRILFICCAAALFIAGCAAPTGNPPDAPGAGNTTPNLASTQWRLESLGSTDAPTPIVQGTRVTLEFQADGKAGGDSGCNSYGGTYLIRDGKISFGELTTTLRACADERFNQQEQQYIKALQSAGTIEQSGDRLTIWYDSDKSALHFVRGTAAYEFITINF